MNVPDTAEKFLKLHKLVLYSAEGRPIGISGRCGDGTLGAAFEATKEYLTSTEPGLMFDRNSEIATIYEIAQHGPEFGNRIARAVLIAMAENPDILPKPQGFRIKQWIQDVAE